MEMIVQLLLEPRSRIV